MKTNWYKLNGKWIHYDGFYLDGKRLSIKEIYEFESNNKFALEDTADYLLMSKYDKFILKLDIFIKNLLK